MSDSHYSTTRTSQSKFTRWVSTPLKSNEHFNLGPLLKDKTVETYNLPNNTYLPMQPCKKSSNASFIGICRAVEIHFGLKSHLGLCRNSTTQGTALCHIRHLTDLELKRTRVYYIYIYKSSKYIHHYNT